MTTVRGPVVSMLPVRNGEHDLPAHLESVARFADTVVALDDGSTDGTRALLEAHPMVHTVLTNPRRDGYAGWNDSENRSRLLAAALELAPSWAMSLDADEVIGADDATVLRTFLAEGADPEEAYLFPVARMLGEGGHHGGPPLWVGRLFAPRPGHRFPVDRLHFVPIPTAIPPDRWRRTTFRIQHVGSSTAERRQARLAKYREADPHLEWQRSYAHLLHVPEEVREWHPRGRLLPALAQEPLVDELPLEHDEPAMSVVVIAREGDAGLLRSVRAAVHQELDEPFEVLVVVSGGGRTAEELRQAFPQVQVVQIDRPALPGEARNAGWRVARGRWITFPGSHVEMVPGSLAARLSAHRAGWPMVAETMRNGTTTCAGWASYFLDNASTLPGRPSFAFETAPSRCSYHRELLTEVGGFPEDLRTGEDSAVNEELFTRGYGAWREAACTTIHHSPCRTPGILVRHHAARGRGRAQLLTRARARGEITPRYVVSNTVRWLPGRLRSIHREVGRWGGDLRGQYLRSLPLVVLGATSAWLGCWWELGRAAVSRQRATRSRTR